MPPVVIAAGIGAAAGIGGGLLSASAQKKAASKAAGAAKDTATMNNALQEKIYGQNREILNPYVTRGNEAGTAINSLLGISGSLPAAAPAQGTQQFGQPIPVNGQGFIGNEQPGRLSYNLDNGLGGFGAALMQRRVQQQPSSTPMGQVPSATQVTNPNANYNNAFQNYLNSAGYQFQVDQGNQAINQGYAARGALQSGAALKALQTYGQNTATGFFKDYLGLLSNQQGVGLSGANAVAGVGTNYANSVSANNNNAGSAAANAYLQKGNATAGMYGNIAGAIGGLANVFGSSYRPGG